jgi:hypothetical protein
MQPDNLPAILAAASRFWGYVDKRGPDDCWLWLSCRHDRGGYGRFFVAGQVILAHRVSFVLAQHAIPEDCVLHKCDNPPCVNPNDDNSADKVSKGRQHRHPGIRYGGQRKLTAADASAIKQALLNGNLSMTALARQFRVHLNTIAMIRDGKSWRHVTP